MLIRALGFWYLHMVLGLVLVFLLERQRPACYAPLYDNVLSDYIDILRVTLWTLWNAKSNESHKQWVRVFVSVFRICNKILWLLLSWPFTHERVMQLSGQPTLMCSITRISCNPKQFKRQFILKYFMQLPVDCSFNANKADICHTIENIVKYTETDFQTGLNKTSHQDILCASNCTHICGFLMIWYCIRIIHWYNRITVPSYNLAPYSNVYQVRSFVLP